MILPLHHQVRGRVRAILAELYDLSDDTVNIPIESPPNRALGDLGSPVAFELARTLRKAPRVIAQEIAARFTAGDGIARVEAAPNGYLNVFIERRAFLLQRLGVIELPGTAVAQATGPSAVQKTIVEHTAINPNKAAHIGHLRNSALGDTLVRALGFRGTPVEVQNYIDDTGVQVADVVVGFREIEHRDLAGVQAIADATRFDYYCWDLYAKVTEWYTTDKARLAIRAAALHDIEHGVSPTAEIANFIAERVVRCHLKTMARLNIDYHLLTWEGDILRLKFWARAFEVLKHSGAVYLQTEGRLAGCWVMKIDDPIASDDDAEVGADGTSNPAGADGGEEDREKVIVRSNGTVTYVGKDMAYQFWKSGLLGKDFFYRTFARRMDGSQLWATTSHEVDAEVAHPPFGAALATFNVIDVRQAYLQKLLKQALVAVGHADEAERLTHFSYEMVALSHATARDLGYAAPADADDAKRPFVEVSGRKGLGVKADDLIDRLFAKALVEVTRRNPELSEAERRRISELIGVAAVRYFMIKYSRTKVIAFDIDEALSFEGESGPYLQYAVVRANNIFQKLQERAGVSTPALLASLAATPPDALNGEDGDHELWSLVLEAARLDDVVEQVVRSLEFAVLAKYGLGLAQMFNGFYHKAPILNEEREDVKRWRAAAVAYFRQQLTHTLEIMGVGVPSRM
ncbi:MAG: arginine--tRNA ligase [Acidobacteria bacterium]|nr:arginine--tRNA ligase [Acidobacteriota bacterium]